eukprot:m.225403 g.225403  ORF g.225403 m.225403 type:complete len:864 (-) comp17307_c0_seq18:1039-3630(-)
MLLLILHLSLPLITSGILYNVAVHKHEANFDYALVINQLSHHLNASIDTTIHGTIDLEPIPFARSTDFLRIVETTRIDFVLGFGLVTSCAQLNYNAIPLAAEVLEYQNVSTYGYAGVIAALERPDILSVADIQDKIVGLREGGAYDGMKMHLDRLQQMGFQLFHMAKQVQQLPGTVPDLVIALITGVIDVALIEGPWLVTLATIPPFNSYKFRVLNPVETNNYGYPDISQRSTPLYNGLMLSAMPSISPDMRLALMGPSISFRLSIPAVPGLVSAWVQPTPLTNVLRLQHSLQELEDITTQPRCRVSPANATLTDVYTCPYGSYYYPKSVRERQCETASLPCPDGATCVCRPCAIGEPIISSVTFVPTNIEHDRSLDDLSSEQNISKTSVCSRVETCLTLQQRECARVAVLHLDGDHSVCDSFDEHEIDIQPKPSDVTALYADSSTIWVDATFAKVNTYRVSILFHGQHIKQSPFFITVKAATCANANEEPNDIGICGCSSGIIRFGGKCTETYVVAVPLTVLSLMTIGLVFWLLWRKQQAKLDSGWKLDEQELVTDKTEPVLGEGTFATVTRGYFRNIRVAIKTLKTAAAPLSKPTTDVRESDIRRTQYYSSKGNNQQSFIREMKIMTKLRHPCITAILGAVVRGSALKLVLECMEGTLKELLQDRSIDLDLDVKLSFLCDAASGMCYIHSQRPTLIHGDLKPSNLLVDSNLRIKISDFGLASHLTQQCVGSLAFMAPELLNGGWTSPESDSYAYAIVMAEVFTREQVYGDMDPQALPGTVGDIFRQPPVRPAVDTTNLPTSVVTLMHRCWDNNPNTRLSFVAIQTQLQSLELASRCSSEEMTARSKDDSWISSSPPTLQTS